MKTEENNGWVKIETIEDIPTENTEYWCVERRTSEIVREINFIDYNPNFLVNYFSHYQPIIKPKPPLY